MVQFSANDDPLDGPGDHTPGNHSAIVPGTFTVQAANQMLPLVTRIVSDLIALSRDVEQQGDQLRGIESLPTPNKISAFADEISAIKDAFQTDRQRLASCQRELASLGVVVDSIEDGVIDFPAYLNRRPVMLCWKIGEATVSHWHHRNESYQHRRGIAGYCFDVIGPSIV